MAEAEAKIAELKQHAEAIRFGPKDWGASAGLDNLTISRACNGRTAPLHNTVVAMEKALAAEDRRLLRLILGRLGKPELFEQLCPPDEPKAAAA